jgi:small-conductance mechanosensitive channel
MKTIRRMSICRRRENLAGRIGRTRPRRGSARSTIVLLLLGALGLALAVHVPRTEAVGVADSQDILQYLETTVAWYRQFAVEQQNATEPNDFLVVNGDRQSADQVVQLAFEYARAASESISHPSTGDATQLPGADSSRYQGLLQLSAKLDKNTRDLQQELETLRHGLSTATGRKRRDLQSSIAETQSELDLAAARKGAVASMVEFASGAGAGGLRATGLRAQIEALARTVPVASAAPTTGKKNAPSPSEPFAFAAASGVRKAEPSGIWGLAGDLFSLSGKIRSLGERIQMTDALARNARDLRAPLVNSLKKLSRRGDDLAKQADSADPSALVQLKVQLDALTAQFKQTTGLVLPLSEQGILLDHYEQGLMDWQSAVRNEYRMEWRSLLLRLGLLSLFLIGIFVVAKFWRRAIFRYVHDTRRRYQFLLLRKIVLWVATAVVIAFAFANEWGSVATFAGLLTAGVAVALQSVILSVAGYFFLIGRFGIRVGDRVQIAGVRGEVVDVGLVRLHLMELGGGDSQTPSGRVIAFPNSIVFQSTAGLFKQIPGANFAWHEISLALSPESDYTVAEQRVREAVEGAFADYREEIERQHRLMERTLTFMSVSAPGPKYRLQLTPSCLEVTIRFPVDLQHASEMDNRITRELLKALGQKPALELAGTPASGVRLRTDLSASDVASV